MVVFVVLQVSPVPSVAAEVADSGEVQREEGAARVLVPTKQWRKPQSRVWSGRVGINPVKLGVSPCSVTAAATVYGSPCRFARLCSLNFSWSEPCVGNVEQQSQFEVFSNFVDVAITAKGLPY